MSVLDIDDQLKNLLEAQRKALLKIEDIKGRIATLKEQKDITFKRELFECEKISREEKARRDAARFARQTERERSADERYDREPEIARRVQKVLTARGFLMKPKFDTEGHQVGLGIYFPHENPEIDLLEKWGYEPTLRGAADFFEVLRRPSEYRVDLE